MMEKFIRGEVLNKALEKRILDLNVEPKLTTVETEH
jgi:hypothetical protein